MAKRSFHHGNLRTVLLDRAEQTLREGSIEDLSLRELARQAGVSHGAPRSHFIDRQALLDAVAARGFERLADVVVQAGALHRQDLAGRVRAVATAYVQFAVTDAALLELMFSTKTSSPPQEVLDAAKRLFSTFDSLFEADVTAGRFRGQNLERIKLLLVAMLQGVAALITSHRVSAEQGNTLIDDAVNLLVHDEHPPLVP